MRCMQLKASRSVASRRGRKPKVRVIGEGEYAVNVRGVEYTFRHSPNNGRLYATGSVIDEQDMDDVRYARELVSTAITESAAI